MSEENYSVFISFKRSIPNSGGMKTRDCKLAKELQIKLRNRGISAFYSERDVNDPQFIDQIHAAIDNSTIMVVVGTKPEYMTSTWVKHEWLMFINDILTEKKPKNKIITYIEDMTKDNIPFGLRHLNSFCSNQTDNLIDYIVKSLQEIQSNIPSAKDDVSFAEDDIFYQIKGLIKQQEIEEEKARNEEKKIEEALKEQEEENKHFNEVNVAHSDDQSGNEKSTVNEPDKNWTFGSSIPNPIPSVKDKNELLDIIAHLTMPIILMSAIVFLALFGHIIIPRQPDPQTTYSYYVTNGNVVITGFMDASDSDLPSKIPSHLIIPDEINQKPVVGIGDYAFFECDWLKSVEIPDTVTSFGVYSFYNCTSLEYIDISNNTTLIDSYAFYKCTSLKSVAIPDSVDIIGEGAFSDCTSLKAVNFSNSIKSINEYAFSDCTSLQAVKIPEITTSFGSHVFEGCSKLESVTIVNGIKSISEYTFSECISLKDIDIPLSVEAIGAYAFNGCKSLKKAELSNKVAIIDDYAFSGCKSLESINIPNDINEIGSYAFNHCNSLKAVSLSSKIETIKSNTFNNCTSLKDVNISEGVKTISDFAFSNCTDLETISIPASVSTMSAVSFNNCSSLESITVNEDNQCYRSEKGVLFSKNMQHIVCYPPKKGDSYIIPYDVVSIDRRAFYKCSTLYYLEIQNRVQFIEESAFEKCEALTSLKLPNSLTFINKSAFKDCIKLNNINIPQGVKSIGDEAFFNCESFNSVTMPISITKIGENVFEGCKLPLTIYGQKNSYAEQYAESNDFSFKIKYYTSENNNSNNIPNSDNTSRGFTRVIHIFNADGTVRIVYEYYKYDSETGLYVYDQEESDRLNGVNSSQSSDTSSQ